MFQENVSVNRVGDPVASCPSRSIFPDSSTPIRPQIHQISQHIQEMSPVERVPSAKCVENDTTTILDCSSGETSDVLPSDKQYTKLGSFANIRNCPINALN